MPTLTADYSDEYQYIEGIEDAGLTFASTRAFRTSPAPTAPTSGIKVRRGETTQAEITVVANTVGLESTDIMWTVFATTLRDGGVSSGDKIEPLPDDILTVDSVRYRIVWVRRAADGAQYRCFCRRSVL